MTIIYAATEDQHLIATILPKLAPDNVNTVRLRVTFDKSWDSYPVKSAVFTTSKSVRPYPVTMTAGGDCLIPAEVLAEECKLYIVVKGENSATGAKKSTTRLTVKVLAGQPAVIISDPAPGVYQQLLTENAVLLSRMSELEKAGTVDGSEVIGIRTGADGTVYATAGDAMRGQVGTVERRLEQRTAPLAGVSPVYTNARANNMIDKSRIVAGFYVDTMGQKKASAGWNMTAPISVAGLSTVYFTSGVGLTCFYKADGTFISYVQNGSDVAVPPDADYLIASIIDAYLPDAMISRYKDQGYDNGFAMLGKKAYESGFIPFTVPVNQTGADNSVQSDAPSEGTEDYIDVDCILSLPITYRATGAPSKLLMMCHGAGKGATEWKEHDGYQAIVKKFVDRGYAVFDCNGFKNDALGWSFWGHPKGVEAWRKAYQYVVNNYNVESAFSIYAFSMGGLTALNLALQGFPGIKSIALGSPVINLQACWSDASVKPVLQQLYGLGDEWDEAKVTGSNPYKHIVSISLKKYCFKNLPPIKIWYGSTETSGGVNKQYAIDLVTAITNAGGRAEYREVNGAGHDICYGQHEWCNIDYLLFTERYNLPHERM